MCAEQLIGQEWRALGQWNAHQYTAWIIVDATLGYIEHRLSCHSRGSSNGAAATIIISERHDDGDV